MSTLMNGLGAADYVAIALAIGALAALVVEVAAKRPRSFLEMMTDSRRFAERPLPAESREQAVPSARRPGLERAAEAAEERRLAA